MAQFDAGNYIDVQERIVRFWSENPEGAIRTRLMSPPDDFTQCRYEAAVYKLAAQQCGPDATGWAFEVAAPGTRGPNATSHEENCETSAIGRALANMGYATTRQDRPSRQEMTKVARGTDAPGPAPQTRPQPVPAASPPRQAPMAGETVQQEYARRLASAGTLGDLEKVAAEMRDAGVGTDELRAIFTNRRAAFYAAS